MWASVFNFFDNGFRRTLQFVKWDSENTENRQPSSKRHLEEDEEVRGSERIIKVRRTDSSHLSPYLSRLMEGTRETVTVPDNEEHRRRELNNCKMESFESVRGKDCLKEQMECLSADHEVTPLGENGGDLKSTLSRALKMSSLDSFRSHTGVRLKSDEELRSMPSTSANASPPPRFTSVMEKLQQLKCDSDLKSSPSTSANASSPPRLSSVLEKLQREEKERYSMLLQNCTNIPVAPKLSAILGRRKSIEVPESIKSRSSQKNEIVEIDLTSDSSLAPKDLDVSSREIVTSSLEFKKRIEQCEAFDANWPNEISNIYRRHETGKSRERLRAAMKEPESSYLLQSVLEERMLQFVKLSGHVIEEGPFPIADEEESRLPELTGEMERRINAAFQRSGSPGDVLSEAFSQRITRRDIHTLTGTNWLNDEVINFYMNLLIERGKNDNYPSVYCFNTFFYPKLAQSGHASLKRWTRKIDIFAHEILIIPVHLGVHWCLACVKFREKRIEYYDSMGGANHSCLHNILKYLQDESLDKKKKPFDNTGWKTENISDNPHQMNGSDCGMFSCMYAEYICRKAKITFSQKDMPYFRRKMAYEILIKRLLL